MNSDWSLDHPNVVAWRINDFANRYKNSISGDQWVSDPYVLEHLERGPFPFHLVFCPKHTISPNSCAFYLEIGDDQPSPSFPSNCEAWMQKTDGSKSEMEVTTLAVRRLFRQGWTPFVSSEQLEEFCAVPTFFLCVKLPYEVYKVGIASEVPILHRWSTSLDDTSDRSRLFERERQSGLFFVHGLDDLKFCISLHLNGPREHQGKRGVYLNLKHAANRQSAHVQFELWMENENKERTWKYATNYLYEKVGVYGCSSYIGLAELNQFAEQRPVTICCKIRPILENVIAPHCVSFHRQLEHLFNVEAFANIEVRGKQKTFKVNDLVLGTQSSVLRAMFTNPLKKRDENIIEITDIDDEVLEALLRFFYTGKVENLTEIAWDLLPKADFYDLPLLVKMCTDSLIDNLNVDNVLGDLKLASRLDHLTKFKYRVLGFARKNCNAIMSLPDWEQFAVDNPEIVSLLLKDWMK